VTEEKEGPLEIGGRLRWSRWRSGMRSWYAWHLNDLVPRWCRARRVDGNATRLPSSQNATTGTWYPGTWSRFCDITSAVWENKPRFVVQGTAREVIIYVIYIIFHNYMTPSSPHHPTPSFYRLYTATPTVLPPPHRHTNHYYHYYHYYHYHQTTRTSLLPLLPENTDTSTTPPLYLLSTIQLPLLSPPTYMQTLRTVGHRPVTTMSFFDSLNCLKGLQMRIAFFYTQFTFTCL
jgi:hypothetical protein